MRWIFCIKLWLFDVLWLRYIMMNDQNQNLPFFFVFFFALMYLIQWSKLKSKTNYRFNKEKSQSHLMRCFICYDNSKVLPFGISRPALTTMRVKAKPHIWHMIYTHHNSFFFVFHSHNIKHNWCYNGLSKLRRKKILVDKLWGRNYIRFFYKITRCMIKKIGLLLYTRWV